MYAQSWWCCPSLALQAGCGAILVGEAIVKQGDPEAGVKQLLSIA